MSKRERIIDTTGSKIEAQISLFFTLYKNYQKGERSVSVAVSCSVCDSTSDVRLVRGRCADWKMGLQQRFLQHFAMIIL